MLLHDRLLGQAALEILQATEGTVECIPRRSLWFEGIAAMIPCHLPRCPLCYFCEHFVVTTLLAAILFAEFIVVGNRVGQESEVGHSMTVCAEKDSETSRASRLPSLRSFTEY